MRRVTEAGGYGTDLAYVHDAGFSEYALGAAPGLLRLLRDGRVGSGLVTDLGCGSGRWARELNRAGYEVFGVDQSPAFIRMARRIAPGSTFAVGSLSSVELPASDWRLFAPRGFVGRLHGSEDGNWGAILRRG